jgi:hypothetical protein
MIAVCLHSKTVGQLALGAACERTWGPHCRYARHLIAVCSAPRCRLAAVLLFVGRLDSCQCLGSACLPSALCTIMLRYDPL